MENNYILLFLSASRPPSQISVFRHTFLFLSPFKPFARVSSFLQRRRCPSIY